ncbi:MAG: SPOR domain-containing protein [Halieaceae bacterium]|jgi:cell division septation protein DedD|nr:SPOR domain-containing protein [Halieaceae bacterium]
MNDNDSRNKLAGDRRGPDTTAGERTDPTRRPERREPVFTDFDEEEDYEEAERDTDYAAAYEGEPEEEEDYLEEEDGDIPTEWQVLGATPAAARGTQPGNRNPWAVEEDASAGAAGPDRREPVDPDDEDDWDDGVEDDDYSDESDDFVEEDRAQGWPLGLVIVGIIALVLLAAGGYGVIQQRSATQDEIRQLQAALATAASPAEVVASRDALREMEQRFTRSEATIDALTLENRRLTDTVAGLEKQLAAQQSAMARVAGSEPPAAARSAPAPKAVPAAAPKAAPRPAQQPAPKPAQAPATKAAAQAAVAGGDWFVNFSSYGQRSVAESWANKLKPSLGKVIVASAVKDGRTFYRVRVAGLADRAQAQEVAAELQAAHRVPPLWVGRE